MPTSARRWASSLPSSGSGLPSMAIDPDSKVSRRLMVRQSVDLPDPDGPRTTTTSPLSTVRSMSLSTCSSPKCLLTLEISTIGSPTFGGGGGAGVEGSESCRESSGASLIGATYRSARFAGVTTAPLAPNCEETMGATCGYAVGWAGFRLMIGAVSARLGGLGAGTGRP